MALRQNIQPENYQIFLEKFYQKGSDNSVSRETSPIPQPDPNDSQSPEKIIAAKDDLIEVLKDQSRKDDEWRAIIKDLSESYKLLAGKIFEISSQPAQSLKGKKVGEKDGSMKLGTSDDESVEKGDKKKNAK